MLSTKWESDMEFADRLLTCSDCGGEFIFTAGEQLFFFDKQFKNDPKRCKPCKSRRAVASAGPGAGPVAAGISRTETRTSCSACGIETTVPFKPTQGRPVLCRQCFQSQRPVANPALVAEQAGTMLNAQLGHGLVSGVDSPTMVTPEISAPLIDLIASASRA